MEGNRCGCTLSRNCGDCTCLGDWTFIELKFVLGGNGVGCALWC